MNISRRRFIQSTAALFAAPAIVKAESLMKIQVPSTKIYTGEFPRGNQSLNDFNYQMVLQNDQGVIIQRVNLAATSEGHQLILNGEDTAQHTGVLQARIVGKGANKVMPIYGKESTFINAGDTIYIDGSFENFLA